MRILCCSAKDTASQDLVIAPALHSAPEKTKPKKEKVKKVLKKVASVLIPSRKGRAPCDTPALLATDAPAPLDVNASDFVIIDEELSAAFDRLSSTFSELASSVAPQSAGPPRLPSLSSTSPLTANSAQFPVEVMGTPTKTEDPATASSMRRSIAMASMHAPNPVEVPCFEESRQPYPDTRRVSSDQSKELKGQIPARRAGGRRLPNVRSSPHVRGSRVARKPSIGVNAENLSPTEGCLQGDKDGAEREQKMTIADVQLDSCCDSVDVPEEVHEPCIIDLGFGPVDIAKVDKNLQKLGCSRNDSSAADSKIWSDHNVNIAIEMENESDEVNAAEPTMLIKDDNTKAGDAAIAPQQEHKVATMTEHPAHVESDGQTEGSEPDPASREVIKDGMIGETFTHVVEGRYMKDNNDVVSQNPSLKQAKSEDEIQEPVSVEPLPVVGIDVGVGRKATSQEDAVCNTEGNEPAIVPKHEGHPAQICEAPLSGSLMLTSSMSNGSAEGASQHDLHSIWANSAESLVHVTDGNSEASECVAIEAKDTQPGGVVPGGFLTKVKDSSTDGKDAQNMLKEARKILSRTTDTTTDGIDVKAFVDNVPVTIPPFTLQIATAAPAPEPASPAAPAHTPVVEKVHVPIATGADIQRIIGRVLAYATQTVLSPEKPAAEEPKPLRPVLPLDTSGASILTHAARGGLARFVQREQQRLDERRAKLDHLAWLLVRLGVEVDGGDGEMGMEGEENGRVAGLREFVSHCERAAAGWNAYVHALTAQVTLVPAPAPAVIIATKPTPINATGRSTVLATKPALILATKPSPASAPVPAGFTEAAATTGSQPTPVPTFTLGDARMSKEACTDPKEHVDANGPAPPLALAKEARPVARAMQRRRETDAGLMGVTSRPIPQAGKGKEDLREREERELTVQERRLARLREWRATRAFESLVASKAGRMSTGEGEAGEVRVGDGVRVGREGMLKDVEGKERNSTLEVGTHTIFARETCPPVATSGSQAHANVHKEHSNAEQVSKIIISAHLPPLMPPRKAIRAATSLSVPPLDFNISDALPIATSTPLAVRSQPKSREGIKLKTNMHNTNDTKTTKTTSASATREGRTSTAGGAENMYPSGRACTIINNPYLSTNANAKMNTNASRTRLALTTTHTKTNALNDTYTQTSKGESRTQLTHTSIHHIDTNTRMTTGMSASSLTGGRGAKQTCFAGDEMRAALQDVRNVPVHGEYQAKAQRIVASAWLATQVRR